MRWGIALLAFLLAVSDLAWVEGALVQWAGNGHWYEAVYYGTRDSGLGWTVARDAAIARGGYLATLTSAEENSFAFSLVASDPNFWFTDNYGMHFGPWIGGFQPPTAPEPDGDWRWVTGEPWGYTHWVAGAPGVHPEHDYLLFKYSGDTLEPTWYDWWGNLGHWTPRGYLVEYNQAIPEPASLIVWLLLGALGVGVGWSRRRKGA